MKKPASERIRSDLPGKGQIALPASVRKAADASQAWFWTQEWQAAERQASDDIKAKRTTHLKTSKEFQSSLKK